MNSMINQLGLLESGGVYTTVRHRLAYFPLPILRWHCPFLSPLDWALVWSTLGSCCTGMLFLFPSPLQSLLPQGFLVLQDHALLTFPAPSRLPLSWLPCVPRESHTGHTGLLCTCTLALTAPSAPLTLWIRLGLDPHSPTPLGDNCTSLLSSQALTPFLLQPSQPPSFLQC